MRRKKERKEEKKKKKKKDIKKKKDKVMRKTRGYPRTMVAPLSIGVRPAKIPDSHIFVLFPLFTVHELWVPQNFFLCFFFFFFAFVSVPWWKWCRTTFCVLSSNVVLFCFLSS